MARTECPIPAAEVAKVQASIRADLRVVPLEQALVRYASYMADAKSAVAALERGSIVLGKNGKILRDEDASLLATFVECKEALGNASHTFDVYAVPIPQEQAEEIEAVLTVACDLAVKHHVTPFPRRTLAYASA